MVYGYVAPDTCDKSTHPDANWSQSGSVDTQAFLFVTILNSRMPPGWLLHNLPRPARDLNLCKRDVPAAA
jgi:hypothetical protein